MTLDKVYFHNVFIYKFRRTFLKIAMDKVLHTNFKLSLKEMFLNLGKKNLQSLSEIQK